MIRFSLLFNLIIIGLLVPATTHALPSKVTVLNVKIGDRNRDLVIIHVLHNEDEVSARGPAEKEQLDEYLKQWDTVVLKHRHNFMWYMEGSFKSLLGESVSTPLLEVDHPYHRTLFLTRPLPVLNSTLSAAAVDIRVLTKFFVHPSVKEGFHSNWPLVSEVLRQAQDTINNYGSDRAKEHAQAIISVNEEAASLSAEEKKEKAPSLKLLHQNHHFDMLALGSILYALANYPQPCILICGSCKEPY